MTAVVVIVSRAYMAKVAADAAAIALTLALAEPQTLQPAKPVHPPQI